MGKRSRRAESAVVQSAPAVEGEIPEVPGRQPCPCGSGKRYKQCHGLSRAHASTALTERPFKGLPGEADWVALREIVPAASAEQQTRDGIPVAISTVLPMGFAAIHRSDGAAALGLQQRTGSGDPSRDLAAALTTALDGEPGTPVFPVTSQPGAPTLQDVLDPGQPFRVTLHASYSYWVDAGIAEEGDIDQQRLRQADESMIPTERLASVDAAYWCVIGERTHLRWVLSGDEDPTLDGIARLHARGESGLGEGTRYLGAFRSCGLLVPVWDLVPGAQPDDVEDDAARFAARLAEASADTTPLTVDERRARAGVVSRQLTLR